MAAVEQTLSLRSSSGASAAQASKVQAAAAATVEKEEEEDEDDDDDDDDYEEEEENSSLEEISNPVLEIYGSDIARSLPEKDKVEWLKVRLSVFFFFFVFLFFWIVALSFCRCCGGSCVRREACVGDVGACTCVCDGDGDCDREAEPASNVGARRW